MRHLFSPKFYSPIQSNVGQNFGDGPNFVICEHILNFMTSQSQIMTLHSIELRCHTCKLVGTWPLSRNRTVVYMAEKYGLAAARTALCALKTRPSTCSSASHRRPCSWSWANPESSCEGDTLYFF